MKQKKIVEPEPKIQCNCSTETLLSQLGKVTPSPSGRLIGQHVLFCHKHDQDITRKLNG